MEQENQKRNSLLHLRKMSIIRMKDLLNSNNTNIEELEKVKKMYMRISNELYKIGIN
jgi:hypothetical protein